MWGVDLPSIVGGYTPLCTVIMCCVMVVSRMQYEDWLAVELRRSAAADDDDLTSLAVCLRGRLMQFCLLSTSVTRLCVCRVQMLIDGMRSLPPYAVLDVAAAADQGIARAPLTFDPAGHHAYVLTGSRVSEW